MAEGDASKPDPQRRVGPSGPKPPDRSRPAVPPPGSVRKPSPPAGKLPSGKVPAAQPPSAQPPSAQPPSAQPPSAQPPSAQPPKAPIVARPVGHAAPPVAPPPRQQGTEPAYRPGRTRRGAPALLWAAIGLGLVGIGVMAWLLYDRTRQDALARNTPVANAADAAADNDTSDKKPDDKTNDTQPADAAKSPPDDKSPNAKTPEGKAPVEKSADAKTDDKQAHDPKANDPKASDKEKSPPKAKPSRAKLAAKVSKYPLPELAPEEESLPPELATMLDEAVKLLEADQFDEFLQQHTFPPQLTAKKAAAPTAGDLASRGCEATLAAIKLIAEKHRPARALVEDKSVLTFLLAHETQPQFVLVDGQWRLHRGPLVTFAALPHQDYLEAELTVLADGQRASAIIPGPRQDKERIAITKLRDMGAVLAFNSEEDTKQRTAVFLGNKYTGEDEGLELLDRLTNVEIFIMDAAAGHSEDGLVCISYLKKLRLFRYVNIRGPLEEPLTSHLRDLPALESVDLEAAELKDNDFAALKQSSKLRRLRVRAKGPTLEALPHLADLENLEAVTLHAEKIKAPPEDLAPLRESRPRLWIDVLP